MSFISIYITNENEVEAQKIADALMEQRLIACANLFPIQSVYWWQGAIQKEGEWVALVKTVGENWQAVQDLVEQLHPYEVPCMMKTEVSANAAYEQWIRNSVKSTGEG